MEIFSPQQCLACGKPMVGRADKKFCDAQCRNAYHNQARPKAERMIIAVNRQLRKNRTVLKTLCPTGKATVRKSVLLDMGFSFKYFSTIYPVGERKYYFSYEYGFAPIREKDKHGQQVEKVLIVQRQEYMTEVLDPWATV